MEMNKKMKYEKYQKHTEKYTFCKKVGEGTYGKVFKAKHNDSGATVAIKVINLENHFSTTYMTVLSREIEILYRLSKQKENVYTTKLLDAFFNVDADTSNPETVTKIFLVMTYVDHDLKVLIDPENEN